MTEAELFTRLNKIFRKVFDDSSIVVTRRTTLYLSRVRMSLHPKIS